MAAAFVQEAGNASADATHNTLVTTISTTAGNVLYCWIMTKAGLTEVISDSAGNTWISVLSIGDMALWRTQGPTAAVTSVTATSGSNGTAVMSVFEISGENPYYLVAGGGGTNSGTQPPLPVIAQTAPVGHTTTGTTVSATLASTPAATSTLIAVVCLEGGATVTGSTLAWAVDTTTTEGATVAVLSVLSDGSTKAFTFTDTGGSSGENWCVLMEVTGLAASPKDNTATVLNSSSVTSWSASMAANTNPNALEIFVVGLDSFNSDPSGPTFSNGFSASDELSAIGSGTAISLLLGTKIVTTSDTPSSTIAWTGSTFAAGIGVSYKGQTGTPPTETTSVARSMNPMLLACIGNFFAGTNTASGFTAGWTETPTRTCTVASNQCQIMPAWQVSPTTVDGVTTFTFGATLGNPTTWEVIVGQFSPAPTSVSPGETMGRENDYIGELWPSPQFAYNQIAPGGEIAEWEV